MSLRSIFLAMWAKSKAATRLKKGQQRRRKRERRKVCRRSDESGPEHLRKDIALPPLIEIAVFAGADDRGFAWSDRNVRIASDGVWRCRCRLWLVVRTGRAPLTHFLDASHRAAAQWSPCLHDRQFWVTGPTIKQLPQLSTCSILTFIILPLFLADIFLLAKAGFSPLSYLGALLWLQLFWTLFLLLPTAALATVTRNIGHMLLALLFILLFGIGMGIISSAIPNSGYASTTANACFFFIAATIARTPVAVLLPEKCTHGDACFPLPTPDPHRSALSHPDRPRFPPRLAQCTAATHSHCRQPDEGAKVGNSVIVHLPFTYSGMPKDSFVMLKGRMLT